MSAETISNKFISIPKFAIGLSLIFHVAVTVVLINSSFLGQVGLSVLGKKPDTKEVYQSFIQVDVVALPDQLFKDQVAVDTSMPIVERPELSKEEAVPKEEAKDEMSLAEKQEAAKAEVKRKEAEQQAKKKAEEQKRKEDQAKALKQLQEEAKREQALKALSDVKGKGGRGKLAGNKLSTGTATTGAIGTQKDRWTSLVGQAIKNNFNIFPWQKKKNLTATIALELYPTGRLKDRKVVKRSADPTFDSAVLQAADAAQPLPLPDDLSLLREPIIIEFKPEE